jgi:hypothetical protein
MHERNVFSGEYFKFIAGLLGQTSGSNARELCKLGTEYILDVISHAYDNRPLQEVCNALKALYGTCPEAVTDFADHLVETNFQSFTDSLLMCTDKDSRCFLSDFFGFIVNELVKVDFSENSVAKKLITSVFSLIPTEAPKYWTKFTQFWNFLHDFAQGGDA